jgi:hypothetical protein
MQRLDAGRFGAHVVVRWLALGAVLATICLSMGAGRASAVGCSGRECLPGIGYTIEAIWNCGQIHSETRCYYREVTSEGSATAHTWGWGSASYSGEGSVTVEVIAVRSGFIVFGSAGVNLARACYEEFCNDQSIDSMKMYVDNSGFHTISGHGKA